MADEVRCPDCLPPCVVRQKVQGGHAVLDAVLNDARSDQVPGDEQPVCLVISGLEHEQGSAGRTVDLGRDRRARDFQKGDSHVTARPHQPQIG